MSKAQQRRTALEIRSALSPQVRESASRAACARLIGLPEAQRAACVFCFVSFRTELDTRSFLEWVLTSKKRLCVPLITAPRLMDAVAVQDLAADIAPGHWGIPEPRHGSQVVAPEDVDLVVLPGAAFDADGGRVGYGGGYYDTFIERLRPAVPLVALAFEAQVVDRVACERHDVPVHVIVTESRTIRCDGSDVT